MPALSLFTISSSRLKIDLEYPGAFYRGPRFDWTGHVRQVTLDEKHTFCAVESLIHGKGTGGLGLSNEFGLSTILTRSPIGSGKPYPKLGVGLLLPPEKETQPPTPPTVHEPFAMTVESDAHSAQFTITPTPCDGYAARITKKIRVEENKLFVTYSLVNVGEKPIITDEYNHNFIRINDFTIGPDYQLSFPFSLSIDPSITEVGDIFTYPPNQISFKHIAQKVYYGIFYGFENCKSVHYWEMKHIPTGIGVRETVDFKVSRMAIWGEPHVLSPEFFIALNINPGDKAEWTRQYTFFD